MYKIVSFINILFVLHNKHEANYSKNSGNNIDYQKFFVNIHIFSSDLNINMLKPNKIVEIIDPVTKDILLTLWEIKNPTTVDAKIIFDRSAKNFDADSVCNLFNLNGIF